jgi:hypothetical protein
MNEIETLRAMMQKHMEAEKYETARQYLYLIERLTETGGEDMMSEPMEA